MSYTQEEDCEFILPNDTHCGYADGNHGESRILRVALEGADDDSVESYSMEEVINMPMTSTAALRPAHESTRTNIDTLVEQLIQDVHDLSDVLDDACASAADSNDMSAITSDVSTMDLIANRMQRNDWAGPYRFRVKLVSSQINSRTHAYNEHLHILFSNAATNIDVSINIERSHRNMRIRVIPIFVNERNCPVSRCLVHREAAHVWNKEFQHCLQHVVRSPHSSAQHVTCGSKKNRMAVVMPFVKPARNTDDFTFPLQFGCLSTCNSGISRRRMGLIFSLEDTRNDALLGKRFVEVKVCSCPFRDSAMELKRRTSRIRRFQRATQRKVSANVSSASNSIKKYTIEADDQAMYDCLLEMRDSLRKFRKNVNKNTESSSQPLDDSSNSHAVLEQHKRNRRERSMVEIDSARLQSNDEAPKSSDVQPPKSRKIDSTRFPNGFTYVVDSVRMKIKQEKDTS